METSDQPREPFKYYLRLICTRLLLAPVIVMHFPLIAIIQERVHKLSASMATVVFFVLLLPLVGAVEILAKNEPATHSRQRLLLGKIWAGLLLGLIPFSIAAGPQSALFLIKPLWVPTFVLGALALAAYFWLTIMYERRYAHAA